MLQRCLEESEEATWTMDGEILSRVWHWYFDIWYHYRRLLLAIFFRLFICSPCWWKNVDEAELAKRVNGSRAAGQRRDTRLFNYPGASNTSCSG